MKRVGKILLALTLLTLIGWLWFSRKTPPVPVVPSASALSLITNVPAAALIKPAPLLGETILRGYGAPGSTPEQDLTLLAHLMDNYTLLVKNSAQLPMSANEDWAAAFRGQNPAHEKFLPDDHSALDGQGRLVDRWGTPIFFHALGGHRFEIRSAGPDKIMWTRDDIHRRADGSFLHGDGLNAPSLLETSGHR